MLIYSSLFNFSLIFGTQILNMIMYVFLDNIEIIINKYHP